VTLVKRAEKLRPEPLILVEPGHFNPVVVDPDLLVGVADGDVEGKIVIQHVFVVVGEVELGESDVGDVEVDFVDGTEDEPEYAAGEYGDDDDGGQDFEEEGYEAAAAAATGAAAAGTVVVLLGWDGWAVVGAVEVGLFFCHIGLDERVLGFFCC